MPKSSRRQFLAALSAGGGTLLAGCTATSDQFPEDTTSNACPPFESAHRVVCYDAVDAESIPLVLVPESQSVRPDQPTAFTLRNRSGQRFETNFYHWRLSKRVEGDWYHIAPEFWPEPLTSLPAGEDHTWTVTVATGRVSNGDPIRNVEGTESLTVAGLGGGHYAFATDGWLQDAAPEKSIALAAGFEVNADPLQLTPTDAIAETEWDGETLVARSTRREPGDDDQRDAFILERLDSAETDAEEIIVEQLVRDDQLRDAIALSRSRDADRVRLEEFSSSIPPFGRDDARTYEFRGDRYRVTARDGGSS